MAAYFIVEIEVTDPQAFEEYRKQVSGTIEKYGGRYIVRGGKSETLEGDWHPKRVVVLEFEVDVSGLIPFDGLFALLRDPDRFAEVRLLRHLGTVGWPNGADLDPDVLYAKVTRKPAKAV